MRSSRQQACEAGDKIIAPGVSPGSRIRSSPEHATRATYHRDAVGANRYLRRPDVAQDLCSITPGLAPGPKFFRLLRRLVVTIILTVSLSQPVWNQSTTPQPSTASDSKSLSQVQTAVSRYLDQSNGMTADEAVRYALSHNAELEAARKEIDAANAMVKQARLRANPMLDVEGKREVPPGRDNTVMAGVTLPLELNGRVPTRVAVAEREFEVRERELANRERMLAGEVRMKFGEALAAALKLSFAEQLIDTNEKSFNLIAARVTEGATPPLEQNMALVELNRLKSMRETTEGKVEVALLELRNLLGMSPEQPLRLRGDFDHLIDQLPSLTDATAEALRERPDLRVFSAMESLGNARIAQARAEGHWDASVTAGYERMHAGFPQFGLDEQGALVPIESNFHYLKFGVSILLPVRNKNQGAVEAAASQSAAATSRRKFGELTVRREVASAYAQYDRAARAEEIFRVGAREPAKANLDVVRQTYELGSKTLLDYIAEQRRFIELENDFIDAQLAVYNARVEILRTTASPELIKK